MIDWFSRKGFTADEKALLEAWDRHNACSNSTSPDGDVFKIRLLDAWNDNEERSLRLLEAQEEEISIKIEANAQRYEHKSQTRVPHQDLFLANIDTYGSICTPTEHRDSGRSSGEPRKRGNERPQLSVSFASPLAAPPASPLNPLFTSSPLRFGSLGSMMVAAIIAGGLFIFLWSSRSPNVAIVPIRPARSVLAADQELPTLGRDLTVHPETRDNFAASARRLDDPQSRPEPLVSSTPSGIQPQLDLAITYIKRGDLAMSAGKLDDAQSWFDRAITVRQTLAVDNPSNIELQRDLAITYIKRGDLAMSARKFNDARVWFTKAVAVPEALAATNSSISSTKPQLGLSAPDTKRVSSIAGPVNTGALSQNATVATIATIATIATRVDPSNAGQHDLAVLYEQRGDAELSAGNLDDARDLYKQAIAITEDLAEGNPEDIQWLRGRETLYNKLGDVELMAHNDDDARNWFEMAEEIETRLDSLQNDKWLSAKAGIGRVWITPAG